MNFLVLNEVVTVLESPVTFTAFKGFLCDVNQLMFREVATLFEGPVASVTLKESLALGRLVLADRGVTHAFLRLSAFIWFYSSTAALTVNGLHTLVVSVPTQALLTGCHLGVNLLMLLWVFAVVKGFPTLGILKAFFSVLTQNFLACIFSDVHVQVTIQS